MAHAVLLDVNAPLRDDQGLRFILLGQSDNPNKVNHGTNTFYPFHTCANIYFVGQILVIDRNFFSHF